MRFFGALLALGGGVGTGWAALQASRARRPLDLVAALAAPLLFLVALVGGVLVFVPQFLK
jgi:hypothetical protein